VEKSLIPVIHQNLNLRLTDFGIIMGNRIILKPNLMTRVEKLPYRTKERRSEISIRRPCVEVDTITIGLPDKYRLDKLPPIVSIVTKFGEYSAELFTVNSSIIYIRKFKLFNGDYPVSDYPGLVDFFEKIAVSDESKIAIVKDIN
jgi:hypothetical protein